MLSAHIDPTVHRWSDKRGSAVEARGETTTDSLWERAKRLGWPDREKG